MLQTAIWQHRLPSPRIVVVALITALSGCASTGTTAPSTDKESAAGAAGGVLGATGGAVGGAALGALYGLQCGPAFILCSPVGAVVGGVVGAVKGGQAGARAGVKASRNASAPKSSPESASEPSAPESSGQSTAIKSSSALESDNERPPPRTLDQLLTIIEPAAGATDGSRADAMVLWTPGQGDLAPPLFLHVESLERLTGSIVSLTAGELTTWVAGQGQVDISDAMNAKDGHVCLIAANGQIIEVENVKAAVWREPRISRATVEWRDDAINAVKRSGNYSGTYICGLHNNFHWPQELRINVTSFLERIQ